MRVPAALLLVLMVLPSALAPLRALGQQSSFEKILEITIDIDSPYTEAYYSVATLFTLPMTAPRGPTWSSRPP